MAPAYKSIDGKIFYGPTGKNECIRHEAGIIREIETELAKMVIMGGTNYSNPFDGNVEIVYFNHIGGKSLFARWYEIKHPGMTTTEIPDLRIGGWYTLSIDTDTSEYHFCETCLADNVESYYRFRSSLDAFQHLSSYSGGRH